MKLLFSKKVVLALALCFALPSCTIYTLKDSEILSRAVFHADDSFDRGRFDLTDQALDQAVRIAKPPKIRIAVEEILVSSNATANQTVSNLKKTNQRTIIVPAKFRDTSVIVVGTTEYENLLRDKEILKQLNQDYKALEELKLAVDNELIKKAENAEKLVTDINKMQVKVAEGDTALLKRNIVIAVLVSLIVGGVYLRIKGIL
jgi:hypothetical protein